jgi:hypothetical protein
MGKYQEYWWCLIANKIIACCCSIGDEKNNEGLLEGKLEVLPANYGEGIVYAFMGGRTCYYKTFKKGKERRIESWNGGEEQIIWYEQGGLMLFDDFSVA